MMHSKASSALLPKQKGQTQSQRQAGLMTRPHPNQKYWNGPVHHQKGTTTPRANQNHWSAPGSRAWRQQLPEQLLAPGPSVQRTACAAGPLHSEGRMVYLRCTPTAPNASRSACRGGWGWPGGGAPATNNHGVRGMCGRVNLSTTPARSRPRLNRSPGTRADPSRGRHCKYSTMSKQLQLAVHEQKLCVACGRGAQSHATRVDGVPNLAARLPTCQN